MGSGQGAEGLASTPRIPVADEWSAGAMRMNRCGWRLGNGRIMGIVRGVTVRLGKRLVRRWRVERGWTLRGEGCFRAVR